MREIKIEVTSIIVYTRANGPDEIHFGTKLPRAFPKDVDPSPPTLVMKTQKEKGEQWVFDNFGVWPEVRGLCI